MSRQKRTIWKRRIINCCFILKMMQSQNKLFTLSKTYLESSTVRNRDTERSFIIDTIQFYEKASKYFPKMMMNGKKLSVYHRK